MLELMENLDFFSTIFSRRSIRKFTKEHVAAKQVNQILKSAMYAPSANNEQPWHFIIIEERKKLKEIVKVHPHAKMLKDAPLAILICWDDKLLKTTGYFEQDCAAATQNLLLAVHNLNLGAVWLGVHPREDRKTGLRKLFGIPENIHPFSLIAIGYPDEQKEHPQRFLEDRIHIEKW